MSEVEGYQVLPKQMLAHLEEHTAGGYIYFRIDSYGNVQAYHRFDNEMAFLALCKKMDNFSETIRAEQELNNMMMMDMDFDEIEEDDDDDEGEEWAEK